MENLLDPTEGNALNREVTIINEQGLHARPAARFVRITSKYKEVNLTVLKDGMSVNGKSIIGIMMLGAGQGTKLVLQADGPGAEEVLQELEELILDQFGEGPEN